MRLPRRLFLVFIFVLLLQACAPDIAPIVPPANPTDAPDTASAVTLQSVAPAPPKIQAGGLYRYVDGSLLDAIPNQGPFLMGDGVSPDAPRHQLTVNDFWIYNVEVTNQMYAWCVSVGKCTPPHAADNPNFAAPTYGNYPVVGVNWQQAADYCGFAHGRLPTEAQWEKAASWDASVNAMRAYPWGSRRPSCDYMNYGTCLNKAAPVTQYGRGQSYYGLLNMAGNVFEWTYDWYKPDYYASSPIQDPSGPDTGLRRSIRSSAFGSDAFLSQPARRSSAQPSEHRNNLGFRCVVDDPTYFAPFCVAPVFHGLTVAPSGAPTASGAASTINKPCPDPVIQHYEGCSLNKTPVSFVTVQSSSPTIVTVTGLDACNPGSNDIGSPHQCNLGVTIHADATCNVAAPGAAACPPYFTVDPSNPAQCIAQGRPGACPAGYQYDSQLQCCSVASGNTAPAPLCSVGEHIYNGICVDDATGPWPPISQTLVTANGLDCTPGGSRP
jgi:sulfatase modifying factor 1